MAMSNGACINFILLLIEHRDVTPLTSRIGAAYKGDTSGLKKDEVVIAKDFNREIRAELNPTFHVKRYMPSRYEKRRCSSMMMLSFSLISFKNKE
ncbi:hypothetical protein B5X24_HaOG211839 [Helicoverpa armigera]|nr:hypothetical protein B5X24_HaOG211839 [Helicoverpa armigera]